jgi:signal peptidase II
VRSRWLFWGFFVGFLILDQIVKAWVRHAFNEHGGYPFWPGVFELTLTYNKGIAFGQLQGFGVFLSPIAVIIAAAAGYYSYRHPKEGNWTHVAMGLLASGALGNLYDRVVLHQVTDMFWLRCINFPVFNIADACISVAAGILVVKWTLEGFHKPASAEDPPAADEAPSA